jgi:hypothetical protein
MITQAVRDKFKRFDKMLRVREVCARHPQTGEEHLMIAVERRTYYGHFERIGLVRPDLFGDGSGLLAKLHASDVRQYGGGEKAADAYDAAEAKEKEQRQKTRKAEFIDMAKEGHDHIARKTGRRINNAGMPSGT